MMSTEAMWLFFYLTLCIYCKSLAYYSPYYYFSRMTFTKYQIPNR